MKYAQHDYSVQFKMNSNNDLIDSLALSMSMLGEELNHSTVTTYFLNDIFNSMKDILITIDKKGYIQSVNQSCYDILKYKKKELIKILVSDIFEQEINFEDLIYSKSSEKIYTLISADNIRIPVLLSVSNFVRGDNQEIGIVIMAKDMTSKIEAENKLKESEEKYRTIFENVQDVFYQIDMAGVISDISPSVKNLSDYSREELIGTEVSNLYYNPNDREDFLTLLFEKGELRDYEVKLRTKKGDIKYVSINARYIRDIEGNPNHIDGAIRDISERKKAEEDLKDTLEKLRKLSKHVDKVIEEERLAISRELHDDLGQSLTAVKMDLGSLKQFALDKDVIVKINKISDLVSTTIKSVQRITAQLRPQIIEDVGIEAAIESYINEFIRRSKIDVFLDIDSEINVDHEVSFVVFRIVQESLTNIARHSKASRVDVNINQTYVKVVDNGIGITQNEINAKDSYGIISMKERAASVGGAIEIGNGITCGTVLKLIIPLT